MHPCWAPHNVLPRFFTSTFAVFGFAQVDRGSLKFSGSPRPGGERASKSVQNLRHNLSPFPRRSAAQVTPTLIGTPIFRDRQRCCRFKVRPLTDSMSRAGRRGGRAIGARLKNSIFFSFCNFRNYGVGFSGDPFPRRLIRAFLRDSKQVWQTPLLDGIKDGISPNLSRIPRGQRQTRTSFGFWPCHTSSIRPLNECALAAPENAAPFGAAVNLSQSDRQAGRQARAGCPDHESIRSRNRGRKSCTRKSSFPTLVPKMAKRSD